MELSARYSSLRETAFSSPFKFDILFPLSSMISSLGCPSNSSSEVIKFPLKLIRSRFTSTRDGR